jgi:hypothetical protein
MKTIPQTELDDLHEQVIYKKALEHHKRDRWYQEYFNKQCHICGEFYRGVEQHIARAHFGKAKKNKILEIPEKDIKKLKQLQIPPSK